MAVPGSVNPMMLGGGEAAVYPINQSLRFNSADAYTFRRTPGSDSTSQKKFTVSVWSKRGVIASGTTSNSGRQMIVYTGLSNGSGNLFGLEWRDDEVACIFNGAGSIYPQTVAKFRDPSAWYHIVVAVDTDQATAADRCKIYVNGVQQTLTGTLPSSGFLITNGTTSVHSVGELGSLRSNQYLAEMYYINDQQLAPTDFAETNDDGVWIPKAYEGTFTGTNSYYLKFDSAATNGIGHDDSGNSNTFTTTNFTTSGTGTDVMSDTPTTNWCTLNPLFKHGNSPTISNGNLTVQTASADSTVVGTHGITTGKYYFEGTLTSGSGGGALIGVLGSSEDVQNTSNSLGYYIDAFTYYIDGRKANNNVFASYGDSYTTNDVIGVAIDADNGKIFFSKNGTFQNSGDPAAGTNAAYTSLNSTSTYLPAVGDGTSSNTVTWDLNFGQRTFEYSPPTDFLPLTTSNLPAPDIADGSDYFNTVLYTGNGSTQSITGVGFQPDFTWIKKRDSTGNHMLTDAVRGANIEINSNSTAAEAANTNALTSFDTDGFSVGSDGAVNINNEGLVAWNWLAGNGTQTLTAGSQSATVSVNATAGFSIATYTGTTSAYTVAHGLGVAPKMYINKGRDTATAWWVFHADIGPTAGVRLDSTTAEVTATSLWNDTNPTSTVCHFGAGAASADPFLMYAFAEVDGFSKFGSYTGNGSTDGVFVYLGFRPALLLTKQTNTTGNWIIQDSARGEYNPDLGWLYPDLDAAEETGSSRYCDFLSNGFKIRNGGTGMNTSGGTYVFAAFAENPFGGSGVSPATAR